MPGAVLGKLADLAYGFPADAVLTLTLAPDCDVKPSCVFDVTVTLVPLDFPPDDAMPGDGDVLWRREG